MTKVKTEHKPLSRTQLNVIKSLSGPGRRSICMTCASPRFNDNVELLLSRNPLTPRQR